jgi:hypothetical protein
VKGRKKTSALDLCGSLAVTQLFEILCPLVEGLAFLNDIVVDVVRGFHAVTGVVRDSLCDIDFDAESRKSRAAAAAQVMRSEGGDAVRLESFEGKRHTGDSLAGWAFRG